MFQCCCEEQLDDEMVQVVHLSTWEVSSEVRPAVVGSPASEEKLALPAPAPAAPPAAPPVEFKVSLRRPSAPGSRWGLGLDDLHPSCLFVNNLVPDPGAAVSVHNAAAPEAERIQEFDCITAVNGVTGHSEAMLKAIFQAETQLRLTVQRPVKFSVTCAKEGDAAGLNLKFGTSGNGLFIVSVGDGAVKKRAPEILNKDRIICVNGATGSPEDLTKALREKDPLEMTLVRLENAS